MTLVEKLKTRAVGLLSDTDHQLLNDAADRIDHLEAALRSPDRTARIIRNVAEWTDEARLGLFTALRERYCRGCGRAQPKEGRCPCQNEE